MVTFFEQQVCCRRLPGLGWAWVVFLLVTCLGLCHASAAPGFEAGLDRDIITLGESVTLTLTFEDCSPQGQPSIPNLPGIQIAGSGYTKQSTISGTQVVSLVSFTFSLRPTREGDFIIPALKIPISGSQPLVSKPLRLKVTKVSMAHPEGAPEPAFVRIITPRPQVYVGETILVEIHGYCQNATGPQLQQFTCTGFTTGPMLDFQKPVPQVQISNSVYNDVIYRVPVTAAKTGKLLLGPATWGITLLSGPRDWMGNYSDVRPLTLTSDTPQIEVLPLPTNGVPPGFSGAVGQFALASYEAAPTNLAAGDPITIKIRISGRGSFDSLILPSGQPEWREFKIYPPTSKFDSKDPLQIEGTKYFEQVVAPQNAGIKELPGFEFSFFDPDQKAYRTLTHRTVPLAVHPTAATPQPTIFTPTPPPTDNPTPAQEIVHIKPAMGVLQKSGKPLVQQTGFLALQALAPLAWVGAVFFRRHKEKLANNPRLRRRREVARIVQEGLGKLRTLARENKAEEFYAGVFHLLQEQLGERLDLPSSAITEAALEDLPNTGISPATIGSLRELFHTCNQYRYAPERTGQELASLIPTLESALKDLQGLKSQKNGSAASLILCLFFLASALSARAEDVTTLFNSANKLYEQGKYFEAAAAYQKLIDGGTVSTALYFNLGNACFKAGQTGRAILAYRKAGLISPRDPDVKANLQFARNQIGNPRLPANRWTRWLDTLTINEWTGVTSITLALFFIGLSVRQILLLPRQSFPNSKKPFAVTTLALGIAGAGLAACLALAVHRQLYSHVSVVIVPEAVVRRGPLFEAPSVFTAQDGTELVVVDRKDDWLQVADSSKHSGWLLAKEVAEIK